MTSINTHIAILALCVFLAAQIRATNQNERTLRWQSGNLTTQLGNLAAADTLCADSIRQRGALAQQSDQVKAQYNALLLDLLDLAKTDADAKRVVEKFRIQHQDTPAAP